MRHTPVATPSQGPRADDELAAASERALTEWRTAFDERLDALERALDAPGPNLSALVLDLARVAGDEAEAAARHASLDAQLAVQQEAAAERQALDEARESLAFAERANDELRRSVEEAARTHDETRRALEEAEQALAETRRTLAEARRAAAEAQAQVAQYEDARRLSASREAQITSELDRARRDAVQSEAHAATLQQQLADTTRSVEAQGRELLIFRDRLEQAVQAAEERSRAQERALGDEREHFARVAQDAEARVAAAVAEAERARTQSATVSRELERLRPYEGAAARVASLERELEAQGRVIGALRDELKSARAAQKPTSAPIEVVAGVPPAKPAGAPQAAPPPHVAHVAQADPATKPAAPSRPEPQPEPQQTPTSALDVSASVPVEEAPLFDPPVSEESTGVFSTVADALRAWATEADQAQATPAVSQTPSSPPDAPPTTPAPVDASYETARATARHDLRGLRVAVTVDTAPGTLVDLSSGGAQVVTASMLKPGQHVRVTFPSAGPLASGRAKVAWSRLEPPAQGHSDLQYRAGLTFTQIQPRVITKVLSEHVPSPSGEPVSAGVGRS